MGTRHIFIQNLKFYRKQAGLTQEKLAEKIGMSTSYIGDLEARERFPSAETIDKIADALDVSISTLFGERSCPQNVKDTFEKIYAKTLKDELKNRLSKDVEEVLNLI